MNLSNPTLTPRAILAQGKPWLKGGEGTRRARHCISASCRRLPQLRRTSSESSTFTTSGSRLQSVGTAPVLGLQSGSTERRTSTGCWSGQRSIAGLCRRAICFPSGVTETRRARMRSSLCRTASPARKASAPTRAHSRGPPQGASGNTRSLNASSHAKRHSAARKPRSCGGGTTWTSTLGSGGRRGCRRRVRTRLSSLAVAMRRFRMSAPMRGLPRGETKPRQSAARKTCPCGGG